MILLAGWIGNAMILEGFEVAGRAPGISSHVLGDKIASVCGIRRFW